MGPSDERLYSETRDTRDSDWAPPPCPLTANPPDSNLLCTNVPRAPAVHEAGRICGAASPSVISCRSPAVAHSGTSQPLCVLSK